MTRRAHAAVPPPPPPAARRSTRPPPGRSGPVPKAPAIPRLPVPPPVPGGARKDRTPSGVRLRQAPTPLWKAPSAPPPPPASAARLGRSVAPPAPSKPPPSTLPPSKLPPSKPAPATLAAPRPGSFAPPPASLPPPRFAPPPPRWGDADEDTAPDEDTVVERLDAFDAAWVAAGEEPRSTPDEKRAAAPHELERVGVRVYAAVAELGGWVERRAEDALERGDAALAHASAHRDGRTLYAIGALAAARAALAMSAGAFLLGLLLG